MLRLWVYGTLDEGLPTKVYPLGTFQLTCHGPTKGPTNTPLSRSCCHSRHPVSPSTTCSRFHHHNLDSIKHPISPQNHPHAALSISQMWPEVWPVYSVPLNSEDWETVAPIDTMGNKPLYPTNFNGVAVMALIDSGATHSFVCREWARRHGLKIQPCIPKVMRLFGPLYSPSE